MSRNPIKDFEIDKSAIQYVGHDLQRPECILAERDGTLWSADARGGVARIASDGTQTIITQKRSGHFHDVTSEAARYLQGTLPNGLAFARNGDIFISNFGTDCLELMSRDGTTKVLADNIDGKPIGKVNFVLRDSKDRIWITVSTKIKNWMHALRTDLPTVTLHATRMGNFASWPRASTSPMKSGWMRRKNFSTLSKPPAAVSADCAWTRREIFRPRNLRAVESWQRRVAGRHCPRQFRKSVGHAGLFRQTFRPDARRGTQNPAG